MLNANCTYYLTRSQPPFLGEMIRAVLDAPASFDDWREADAWLAHAFPLALRDYATWARAEHRAGDTGMARYFDYGTGPVLEMRDADYLRDVIDWSLAHPDDDPGYLLKASEHPDAAEAERLKTTSCDVRASDPYITTFYPLWAGAASPQQAQALRGKLALFEHKGGLAMSRHASGAQWDAPFGWAPTNWLAVAGLDAYGFHDDARRIARKFTATIDRSLADDGTIREKYNMVSGNADVKISAGYADNVIGFGWSNGVYLKLRQLLDSTKPRN